MNLEKGALVELKFVPTFHQDEFKLFEVSEEFLKEIQAAELPGLPIRGVEDDEAVVCTSKKTYAVRLVETSNTLLVMPTAPSFVPPASSTESMNLDSDESHAEMSSLPVYGIEGSVSSTYELEEIIPRLHVLRMLLEQCPYQGKEREAEREERVQSIIAEYQAKHSKYVDNVDEACAASMSSSSSETDEIDVDCHDSPSSSSSSSATETISKRRRRFHRQIKTGVHQQIIPSFDRVFTWHELQTLVQASDHQLHAGLQQLNAFTLDLVSGASSTMESGAVIVSEEADQRWRVLDENYRDEVFDLVLATMTEWKLGLSVSLEDDTLRRLCAELPDYPPAVVEQALRMHSLPESAPAASEASSSSSSSSSAESAVIKRALHIDPQKLAKFRASQLFRARPEAAFPYQAFLDAWADLLPRGVAADPQLLKGMALIEQQGSASVAGSGGAKTDGRVLKYLPLSALPPLTVQRFAKLFEVRSTWALEDLEPYIRDLVAPNQTVEQLLLKNTRIMKNVANGVSVNLYTKK